MNRLLPFEWIAAIRFLREGATQTLLIVVGASVGDLPPDLLSELRPRRLERSCALFSVALRDLNGLLLRFRDRDIACGLVAGE